MDMEMTKEILEAEIAAIDAIAAKDVTTEELMERDFLQTQMDALEREGACSSSLA